ncbi:hypothetical protein WA026_020932 [Henosepilachna vigintioctopunctata]|uniref:Juvenile hormone epoxide hydrolase n=1 Tax=Henosepilachna vigintioctopunctata TaxID=420089 RepID=A0AAW1UR04_9CUCU
MSILFPENIIGMHSSMCMNISPSYFLKKILYTLRPSLIVEKKYEHLAYPIPVILPKILEEIGYVHLQATKPDTLGVALTDSPSGLAVYIIEKFLSLSNPNWKNTDVTNLTAQFNTDVLIDNVMIYWVTGTITSSMRLFSEAIHKTESSLLDRFPVRVPAACARFIKDLFYNPVALLEDKYVNLLQVTDNEGGHFPALECPHVLASDIYAFTEKILTLNDKK